MSKIPAFPGMGEGWGEGGRTFCKSIWRGRNGSCCKEANLPVIRILSLLIVLSVLFPQTVSAKKVVQSSGIGVILQEDVDGARDRAIRKALQQSVEESIASLFQFSDLSNFHEAVQGILSEDPLNYIDRYRFVTDARDENLYKVEVEVWVSEDKIKERLAGAGLVSYGEESYQLGVLIGTKIEENALAGVLEGEEGDFTAFASQQFRTRGFSITEGLISVDDSPRSFEKLRVNNQLTAMQGRRLGADAVVLGQIEIRSEESRLGMQIPGDYHVSIWLRAIRSTDAALLGLREKEFTLKQNISTFMLRQMIRQNLDSLLRTLGGDIRKNMR